MYKERKRKTKDVVYENIEKKKLVIAHVDMMVSIKFGNH